MTDEKTKEHHELEQMQQLIGDLPDDRRHQVQVYVEDIRDLLAEGGGDAFLALTLVACEFAATNAELEKEEAEKESIV